MSEPVSAATVGALIERWAGAFEAAAVHFGQGTECAWDEATALVLAVTGLPDEQEVLQTAVEPELVDRIDALAARRIAERVPLAYLLGEQPYCGIDFAVFPGVVVPRSPIGPLLCDGLRPWLPEPPRRILDMCCGSGALGLLGALAFPDAEVVLVDLSGTAVACARANVQRLGLEQRVTVVQSDLFTQVPPLAADLILCNPPYVDPVDMSSLPPEFLHEPASGLAGGGADGLDLMAAVLQTAGAYLTSEGFLIGEVGYSAPALQRRFPRLPFLWLDLPDGGDGVFLLEGGGLASHTARASE